MARPTKRMRAGDLARPTKPVATPTMAEPMMEIDEIAARCSQDDAFKLQLLAVLTETLKAAGVEFDVDPDTGAQGSAGQDTPAASDNSAAVVRAKTQGSNGVMPIELHFSGTVNFKIGAVYTNLNTDN